ncbi:MAG: hypothetical protein KF845_09470 [Cyclobacteriaceae bacterium]|nr:hypothetical protein [Cyclobacteriaceae bacterium]
MKELVNKGLSDVLKNTLLCFLLMCSLLFSSCKDDPEPDPGPTGPDPFTITVNPANTQQEMIGFGGALTWYSTWLTNNVNKAQIADLIFDDLGIDIIRFKTWYYPDGYPDNTSTATMSDDGSKAHWDATNELYQMAKSRNPNVKILLSSWGPPAGLKSNNSSRQGTLKKDEDGNFMYDAYADYWEHTLDHLPFNPDYLSIQNEPTYTNSGWTTSQWTINETPNFPAYSIAFDKVYDKIKDKENPPVMIGPESQDVPTFAPFASILKDKPHCGVLAYHPYNITSATSNTQVISSLQTIGNFTTKPNLMTEFSDNGFTWFNTAVFIQNTLLHANSSGYIYWKLVWAAPSAGNPDNAMVSIAGSASSSTFTVTPFYHVIKHFSKHIDAGHKRVDASSSNANLSVSAFVNPANNKLTLIIINTGPGQVETGLAVTGKTITNVSAYRSAQNSYYQTVEGTSPTGPLVLPSQTITTVVLDI